MMKMQIQRHLRSFSLPDVQEYPLLTLLPKQFQHSDSHIFPQKNHHLHLVHLITLHLRECLSHLVSSHIAIPSVFKFALDSEQDEGSTLGDTMEQPNLEPEDSSSSESSEPSSSEPSPSEAKSLKRSQQGVKKRKKKLKGAKDIWNFYNLENGKHVCILCKYDYYVFLEYMYLI